MDVNPKFFYPMQLFELAKNLSQKLADSNYEYLESDERYLLNRLLESLDNTRQIIARDLLQYSALLTEKESLQTLIIEVQAYTQHLEDQMREVISPYHFTNMNIKNEFDYLRQLLIDHIKNLESIAAHRPTQPV